MKLVTSVSPLDQALLDLRRVKDFTFSTTLEEREPLLVEMRQWRSKLTVRAFIRNYPTQGYQIYIKVLHRIMLGTARYSYPYD